jgi:hypothetical protein
MTEVYWICRGDSQSVENTLNRVLEENNAAILKKFDITEDASFKSGSRAVGVIMVEV